MKDAPQGTVRDWLDTRAKEGGTAFLFPQDTTEITWSELRNRAVQIAQSITSKGAKPGDSIVILHPNGMDGILALFGILYGGFRATMINLVAGDDAISYALDHCDAEFAFVHDDHIGLFARNVPLRGIQPLDLATRADTQLHDITPDTHALLMYTSGTTGQPKGVIHSHSSLLAGGWTSVVAHDLARDDRGLCVLPVYHINGLCVSVMGALVSGGSLVLCPKFSASKFWQIAQHYQVTWFSAVPTIISHMLHNETDPDADTKARIRFGRSASSAMPIDVHTAFESRFEIPLIETMGLTETSAQILSNPMPPNVRKIGSPGKAIGNEIAILDDHGHSRPNNIEGEIAVRGPNLMLEYLKNPEATKATFTSDGWLRTGDLGRIDEEGFVFVTGRLKELIIKGGENIAPREIDEALYSHSDVIEAAAFARPCASFGERVEAAVKLRHGSDLSAEILIALCKTRIGAFKSPDIIHIMDDLPKGPSGKIQRLKLTAITA